MNAAVIMAFLVVAFVAGWFYQWFVPQVTPHLPASVQNNSLAQATMTGVFVMVTIAVAFFVAKVVSKKGSKRIAAVVTR